MVRGLIASFTSKVLLVAVVAACTALGWFLYEVARNQRFDTVLGEWLHTVLVTIQVMFRIDPIMMLVAFPLGIMVVLILLGLLIWLRRAR